MVLAAAPICSSYRLGEEEHPVIEDGGVLPARTWFSIRRRYGAAVTLAEVCEC